VKAVNIFLTIFLIALFISGTVNAQEEKPCSSSKCRQFDFWLGEWELIWFDKDGNEQKGANTITSILNGCVIQEQFDGNPAMNFKGMSVSVFNEKKDLWQQTWVDNNGGYLDFTGGFQNDVMTLSRETERNGQEIMQRMRWYDIEKDSIKWAWESSKDGGKSWQTNWLLYYKRKRDKVTK